MTRPNNRYRKLEYDYIAHMQGGKFCNICKIPEPKPYGHHIDHIDPDATKPTYNHPSNKRLLCDNDNGIVELERRKSDRLTAQNGGDGSRNLRVSERATKSTESFVPVSKPESGLASASDIMREEERKDSRTSPETKNEINQPLCEAIIEAEWNRQSPTTGLQYPNCVPELVRRIREQTGSGSDAAVKRYIRAMCSDGAKWQIDRKTKRIVPANFESTELTDKRILPIPKAPPVCMTCSRTFDPAEEGSSGLTCAACMKKGSL